MSPCLPFNGKYIVFCHSNNRYQTYTFDGMQISCLETTIPITKPIRWGAYMGSHYDNVFQSATSK